LNCDVYLVVLEYLTDLAKIDAALEAHVRWLDAHYNAGLFLASGRREPRTGGVIFARGDRADVEAAVAADPFATLGLARHSLIEFLPSKFGGPLDNDAIRIALS
jgi:uncharacterized protein YciI